jgi:hypothetical protein
MAHRHELEIVITPSGEVQVDVKGMKGKACLEPMTLFEEAIGRVKTKRLTAEYYAPGPTAHIADREKVRGRQG